MKSVLFYKFYLFVIRLVKFEKIVEVELFVFRLILLFKGFDLLWWECRIIEIVLCFRIFWLYCDWFYGLFDEIIKKNLEFKKRFIDVY